MMRTKNLKNAIDRMKRLRALRWAGFLVLCLGLTGETCLEEKGIDVVVGANVTALFEARGSENVYNDQTVVNLTEDADIQQILEDNGFDEKVVGRIESAFYRVVKQDAGAPDRTVSGEITVDGNTLIEYQSVWVNDPELADWTAAPLTQEGVDYINQILETYFTDIFLGNVPTDPVVTFSISGTSTPTNVETNFDWEIRVKLTLVGKQYVEVPEIL
ncbi:MAG: hypothetical protein GF346_04205 [Candidatus Eisenbacteria bacterium]|nr:hypothetical protein [Candidatus Latescibacterota bacterium]MBD3301629.1 hypothetical protein [Candidatus Eisenbacteria bacterium]